LPPPDEVQVEQEKTTLVIVVPAARPTSCRSPPTGRHGGRSSNTRTASCFSPARATPSRRCSIRPARPAPCKASKTNSSSENTPADDPQWRALDALRDRVGLQFTAALKEAFDQIVYPSINAALRATGTDLAFAGNQNGEATLRHTLEGAQKFTTKIDDDSFRTRAEARLFGSRTPRSCSGPTSNALPPSIPTGRCTRLSALDDLKAECLRRGLWREEGNHIRRGPFPPPVPEVSIRELSVQEDGDGITYLKIEPLHAPAVVFETGDADPTPPPARCRRPPALKRRRCVTVSSPTTLPTWCESAR
jgi:hypothetical protein